jgi:hypothetical protein
LGFDIRQEIAIGGLDFYNRMDYRNLDIGGGNSG